MSTISAILQWMADQVLHSTYTQCTLGGDMLRWLQTMQKNLSQQLSVLLSEQDSSAKISKRSISQNQCCIAQWAGRYIIRHVKLCCLASEKHHFGPERQFFWEACPQTSDPPSYCMLRHALVTWYLPGLQLCPDHTYLEHKCFSNTQHSCSILVPYAYKSVTSLMCAI